MKSKTKGMALLVLVCGLSAVAGTASADKPTRYDCSNEKQEQCGDEKPILDPTNLCNSCYVDFCMSSGTVDSSFAMEYTACDVEFANSCPGSQTACVAEAHLRWHQCYERVKKQHKNDCNTHLETLSNCLTQNGCQE